MTPAPPRVVFGVGDREAWLVVAVVLAVLAPFVGKAFHADDPLFIWTARHVLAHPIDFYGFDVNWYGIEMPMADVMKNPPLLAYYLAAAAGPFGFHEVAVHLVLLVPAALAALGTYRLARRFCTRPLLASLTGVLTPAFVVSGTTAMADVAVLALWVWGVALWLTALEVRSARRMVAASAVVALAVLTKYSAICLVPLLWFHAFVFRENVRLVVVGSAVPLMTIVAYEWLTRSLYRQGLLAGGVQYATDVHAMSSGSPVAAVLIGLVFVGGCFFTCACFAPYLWSRMDWVIGLGVAAGLAVLATRFDAVGAFVLDADGHLRGLIFAQFLLYLVAGWHVARSMMHEAFTGDRQSLFLSAWVTGVFVFACGFNWTVNARVLLPMMPAVAILTVRWLDGVVGPGCDTRQRLVPAVPLVLGGCLALAVATADYAQANSAREAAREVVEKHGSPTSPLLFQGHWGFQFYMEDAGARPVDVQRWDAIPIGAAIAVPMRNSGVVRPEHEAQYPVVERLSFDSSRGLSTLDEDRAAGFYSSLFGVLPFSFGRANPDRYFVARKIAP